MRRISTVTFDLWDTLIQEAPGGSNKVTKLRVERIGEVLERRGFLHSTEELEEAYRKTGAFLDMCWSKNRDMPVRDHVLFMLSCIECRLPSKLSEADFAEIERIYAETILEQPPVLLPKAKEALQAVKGEGYRVGLISNTGRTPGSTLRTVMERLDILRFFDITTFSNEIQVRKPAEAAFRVTLERLDTLPRSAVHVGDDPEKDIEGAKRLGMHAIQILSDRTSRAVQADSHVLDLGDVIDAIARL